MKKLILGLALIIGMGAGSAYGQAGSEVCKQISNPSDAGHSQLAQSFVQAWNEGRVEDARRMFTGNATVRDGFYSDEKKPIGDLLSKAKSAGEVRGRYTIMGIMTDGSNRVVLKMLEASATDEVSEIWVFEVGSGCLSNLHIF
ncbi:hypothetical protein ACWGK7_03460 [Sphingomonas aurantiaca]